MVVPDAAATPSRSRTHHVAPASDRRGHRGSEDPPTHRAARVPARHESPAGEHGGRHGSTRRPLRHGASPARGGAAARAMTRPRAPRSRQSTAPRRKRIRSGLCRPRSRRRAPGSPARCDSPLRATAEAHHPERRRGPRPRGPRCAERTRRPRRARPGSCSRRRCPASRSRPSAARRPAGPARGGRGRPRPGVPGRESWVAYTATAARTAAASSGQPRPLRHHSPSPPSSRVRSQPTAARPARNAASQPTMPYATPGDLPTQQRERVASTGTATSGRVDGGVLGEPHVARAHDEAPRPATDLRAVQRGPPAVRRAQTATPSPSTKSDQPTSAPVPRQSSASRPSRPADWRAEQVDGEHPGDDDPERLGGSAQVLAGHCDRDRPRATR